MNPTAASTAKTAAATGPESDMHVEGLASPEGSEPSKRSRPADIPEKFWDEETQSVRAEALARSYRELERRLGRSVTLPKDDEDIESLNKLYGALGRPASPEDYVIEPPHPLLASEPVLNQKLHEAGLSQRQVQSVYDLAAEHVLPLVADMIESVQAAKQVEALQAHFGGAERWQRVSQQMRSWGNAHLEPDVLEALASSPNGVLALFEMMSKAEPSLAGQNGSGEFGLSEQTLSEMMRDPRYWRDRDPDFTNRVTEGFKRLFPG